MFLEHKIMIKNIYNKSIKIAGHKNSKKFLGFISFIESFIFPIPPDVFIIPMTIAKKYYFHLVCLLDKKIIQLNY